MQEREIKAGAARLERLLADRLGLRKGCLQARAQRAGRRLPGKVRRDLSLVGQAVQTAGHPQLSRQLDPSQIDTAIARAERHLRAIDLAEQRKGRVLGVAGSVIANLLTVFALLVAVLIWRGFL